MNQDDTPFRGMLERRVTWREIAWCVKHDSLAHHRTSGFDYCDIDEITQGIHEIGSMCDVVDAVLVFPEEEE